MELWYIGILVNKNKLSFDIHSTFELWHLKLYYVLFWISLLYSAKMIGSII
jgi:hypothetical protein